MGVETESAQVGPSATKLQRPRLGFQTNIQCLQTLKRTLY